MANYLGAVLEGLNQGVNTGLDLYKTVQSEARAKRAEDYTRARDAIEDQRYEEGFVYRKQQDTLAQANNERDYKLKVRGQDFSEKQQEIENRLAERRIDVDAARMRAADARALLKARIEGNKQTQKHFEQVGTRIANLFDGSAEGFDRGLDLINNSATDHAYAVARAREMGYDIPDELVGQLHFLPSADRSTIALAVPDAEGRLVPFDPDGPGGEVAYALPSTRFSAIVGGKMGATTAATAAEVGAATKESLAAAGGELAARRGGVEGRRQGAAQGLAEVDAQIKALRDEQANLAGLMEKGEYRLAPEGGPAVVENTMPRDNLEAAARARTLQGEVEGLQNRRAVLEDEMGEVRSESRALRAEGPERRAEVDMAMEEIKRLPAGEQRVAARNFREVAATDLDLALRHPGKSLAEATKIERTTRDGLIDKLVSYADTTTAYDEKGRPVSLKAAKADLRTAALTMGPEFMAVADDYTGRTEGAMQQAAQDALNAGRPKAIPYFLYSYAAGVDGKTLVTLMGDESMRGKKFDDKTRFAYANRAVELMRDGETDDPEVALGRALKGPSPKTPKLARGSTLSDALR